MPYLALPIVWAVYGFRFSRNVLYTRRSNEGYFVRLANLPLNSFVFYSDESIGLDCLLDVDHRYHSTCGE
jgi:hypothetical protein